MIRASATIRTNSIGPIGAASASGVPAIGISMLSGTLSGGSGRLASVTSISTRSAVFFTHSEDAATTDLHAGLADIFQCVEPIGKCARGGDLRIIALRCIDIVIVIVEPGRAQPIRLFPVQHAQRHAGFKPERFYRADDFNDGVHIPRLRIAPGGAHAVAGRARFALALRASATIFSTSISLEAARPVELCTDWLQ